MKLAGSYAFTAPQEQVWAMLRNPVTFAEAVPDCQNLRWVHDNRFAGTLHIHAGLFQSKVTGTLTLTTTDKPYEVALQAVGHSAEGNLSGSGHIWLTAEAAQTMLHYDGEISVTGKFADAGTPYLQTVARSIVRQNLTELERHLQQGMSQEDAGETAVILPAISHKRTLLTALSTAVLLGLGGLLLLRKLYQRWLQHLARQVAALLQD
ncbi:MAG: SRPBCC family protein [Ardenticatenaceae bacterium]|nr:SRPBCC family protein [Ardenticatenaceae bacterium]